MANQCNLRIPARTSIENVSKSCHALCEVILLRSCVSYLLAIQIDILLLDNHCVVIDDLIHCMSAGDISLPDLVIVNVRLPVELQEQQIWCQLQPSESHVRHDFVTLQALCAGGGGARHRHVPQLSA